LDSLKIASNIGFYGFGLPDDEEFVCNPRLCEMTVRSTLVGAVLVALTAGITPASAVTVQIPVDYYNMNNGAGTGQFGDYQYWDGTYSGSGNKTTDNAPLSGGKGVLTNGFMANDRWDYYATANGTGQYVGWNTINQSPNILFHLGGDTVIKEISFWMDNSYVGLVGGPESIVINGVTYDSGDWTVTPMTPNLGNAGGAERITIAGLNMTARDIMVLINPGDFGPDALNYNAHPEIFGPNIPGTKEPWLMLSEVQFNGVSAVPELSTWAMMLIGFGLFGFVAYRRKLNRNPAVA
jgi:hypothetical protein